MKSIKDTILESPVGYALWSEPFNRPKLRAIDRMLEAFPPARQKVLDVGCGPGTNAPHFEGWDYLGVDINPQYIAAANRKYPERRFLAGNATQLDLNGERFPLVLINSLMHHLDDGECAQLLGGLRPIIEDESVVITQEPLTPASDEPLKNFFMRHDRGDHFRSLDKWRAVFESGGFGIAAEEFYTLKLGGLVTGWRMYSALLRSTSNDKPQR